MSAEFVSQRPNQEPVTPELVAGLLENAQIVLPEDGVYEKLKSAEESGTQLRVKMGFDPTSPDLHLGHAVSMHQLRRFQDLGHLPVIVIGDFTGRIGDPSGRNQSRPLVTPDELSHNAQTYVEQLGKVLDTSRIEVHRNSEWLEGMTLSDVIHLLAQGTLSQVISRDDFRKRLDAGSPVALHEVIYPFLQGMDSVAIDADIEVGGVDQLYAFQAGRTLQGNKDGDPQALVMMPLLRGRDGVKKMSKTLGNYIGLADEPNNMFGKVMSIPDALLDEYLRLASTFPKEHIEDMLAAIGQGTNPMEVKLQLAANITSLYHGESAAEEARAHFDRQFRGQEEREREYRVVQIGREVSSVVDILLAAGVVSSKTKARQLIAQGAVRIDGEKVSPEDSEGLTDVDGLRIRAGRRDFIQTRVLPEDS